MATEKQSNPNPGQGQDQRQSQNPQPGKSPERAPDKELPGREYRQPGNPQEQGGQQPQRDRRANETDPDGDRVKPV